LIQIKAVSAKRKDASKKAGAAALRPPLTVFLVELHPKARISRRVAVELSAGKSKTFVRSAVRVIGAYSARAARVGVDPDQGLERAELIL
jgi:hypothetical protein